MGLSNQDRKSNIITIVSKITSIEPFEGYLCEDKKQINKIINNLWFYLNGANQNSAHWIFGSSSESQTLAEDDMFGLAMISSYRSDEPEESIINSICSTADNTLSDIEKKWWKYGDEYRPTALSLLKNDRDKCNVYKIYKFIEHYIYNVNRYDDDLSKSFRKLTAKICKLQGHCFKLMSEDLDYFKAYAGEIIFNHLLTGNVDNINLWFMDNNLHHSVHVDVIDKKDLFEAYKKAQLISKSNLEFSKQDRLIIILKFLGRRFNYEHMHKNLFKLINQNNIEYPKDMININVIKSLCSKAIKDSYNYNKETSTNVWSCDLTEQNSYDNNKSLIKDLKKKLK